MASAWLPQRMKVGRAVKGTTAVGNSGAPSMAFLRSKVLLFLREVEAVDNMTCRDLTGLDTHLHAFQSC